MKNIDISGIWLYKTDENNVGIVERWFEKDFRSEQTSDSASKTFVLPGSTCDNHIGKKQEYYETYSKEAVRAPREKYEYIAPLWLQREIELTENDLERDINLFLERVNISSMLWVDGKQVGREIIELSAPHIYDLSSRIFHITSGKHLLTLRIDNRDLLNFGDMASGYSIDTQGYWNGVIGRIELQLLPKIRIDNVQIYTNTDSIDVHIITKCEQHAPLDVLPAALKLTVLSPEGNILGTASSDIELFTSRQRNRLHLPLEGLKRWNEFNHTIYKLHVSLESSKGTDERDYFFGMRVLSVKDKCLMIDERELALRGTINCAQYPLTGYPPMDETTWTEHLTELKSFGLNHVRFHAWCPPEAAFSAADKLGIYFLVEMPMWINRDICPFELGDDPVHESYYMKEARNIRKFYGNHPSFIMFSNGNENMGDYSLLEDCITQLKATDRRCFYTLSSNFDHPVHPCEDYLSAFEMAHVASRIQFLHDKVAVDTCLNYDEVVKKVDVPVISFEVGQYCVYPDVDCIERYTGNMLPVNFNVIRKLMTEKNVYHRLKDYMKASGDMAGKLYKEELEAVFRTKHFGGIQLLSISDYTGQSTATVGIMDVFFKDKEVVSKDYWCGFCNEVVPLFQAKRIYKNTEKLEAVISLYDHGENPVETPFYNVSVNEICGGTGFTYSCSLQADFLTKEAKLSLSLSDIRKPALLKVTVSVAASENTTYTNSWRIFVYPDDISSESSEISDDLSSGRLLISADAFAEYMGVSVNKTNFIPVFWSPVHFPSRDSYGAIVDETHPALSEFPSEHYIDYQWKYLLEHGKSVDISKLNVHPIVEMVPNYVDNTPSSPLFETELNGKKILVCGFDLNAEDITAKALRSSIARYLH